MEKKKNAKDTLEVIMTRNNFNKADLLENAEIMGYNTDHQWDDLGVEQIRNKLVSEILANPKTMLVRLPAEELLMLKILKDAAPGMSVSFRQSERAFAISLLGLAEQVTADDEEEKVFISEDFKEAIRPLIVGVLDDEMVRFRILIEQFLVGALNLYGLLTRSELKRMLKDYYELEDDGSGLFEHVYEQSIGLQLLFYGENRQDEDGFFISPYLVDIGFVEEEREKRHLTIDLKLFDEKTIMEAGACFFPVIPNPVSRKLHNTFERKFGFKELDASYWQFRVWLDVQEENSVDIEVIQELLDAAGSHNKIKDIDDLNEAMGVVVDYMNHSPRWIFYGRSPVDLREEMPRSTSAPRIEIGPNMQRMGYRQEEVQHMVDALWKSSSVGRNEPCPCDSGKKYKHCCGKG